MKTIDLSALTTLELVDRFAEVSQAQYNTLWDDRTKQFNRLYEEMDRIGNELKQRGDEDLKALTSLYGHKNIHVRLNAARRTLSVAFEEAKRELQAIAASRQYPQAADAILSLDKIADGTSRLV